MSRSAAIRNFMLGGLLPILAFALVENWYGTKGGLIAGLVFGGGEIIWEKWHFKKVQGITWTSNLLVIGLGLISLYEDNGVFFKLQPALFMLLFALVCIGSSLIGKPFLVAMAKKQNPNIAPQVLPKLNGLNFRLGVFCLALTALSAYSAFRWSTAVWAILKGVGLPALTALYMVGEFLVMRWRMRQDNLPPV